MCIIFTTIVFIAEPVSTSRLHCVVSTLVATLARVLAAGGYFLKPDWVPHWVLHLGPCSPF